jgi:hypothetical protein
LNTPTRYASEASCNAKTAVLWNRRSILCSCAILWTKCWKGALQMRTSVDFWYLWISLSYVVGNVRNTVTIDVSYTLGNVHIEVTTWAPTYSNCSWMVSMQLFDSPCWWCCCPCSLCSQLLNRSYTTSWLPCCLLHSSLNECTVVLRMGAHAKMMWWWKLLCQKVCTYVSFGASPHSHCGHVLCIMYTMMVILF